MSINESPILFRLISMSSCFPIAILMIDLCYWLYKDLITSFRLFIEHSVIKLYLSKNGFQAKFAHLQYLANFSKYVDSNQQSDFLLFRIKFHSYEHIKHVE